MYAKVCIAANVHTQVAAFIGSKYLESTFSRILALVVEENVKFQVLQRSISAKKTRY